MADKLGIYNDALLHVSERKLANLTENREPRRVLDDVWDQGVRYCLEQGVWNFAMRVQMIDADPVVTPSFGYQFAFAKPGDWIRTAQVSNNERFDQPLRQYADEAGYWYADADPLYVQFVSSDTSYGLNLAGWPATFSEYVSGHLASRIWKRVTGNESGLEDFKRITLKRLRTDARSKDAMNQPAGQPPRGTWVMSRGMGPGGTSRWRGL